MGTQRVKIYQEPASAKATAGKPEKEERPAKAAADNLEDSPASTENSKKPAKTKPPRQRGKKWQTAAALIDKNKTYSIEETLTLLKKVSYSKFDAAVEAHFQLKPKKGQAVRTTLTLPHGSGKEQKVEIFSAEVLEKIQKGKIDFDVLVAKPEALPALAKAARILGPRGLMPSPKSGTVSDKPEEAVKKIRAGQLELRADSQNNLHQLIGRISWEEKKLAENFQALLKAVQPYTPVSTTICTTMSPGVKVKIST